MWPWCIFSEHLVSHLFILFPGLTHTWNDWSSVKHHKQKTWSPQYATSRLSFISPTQKLKKMSDSWRRWNAPWPCFVRTCGGSSCQPRSDMKNWQNKLTENHLLIFSKLCFFDIFFFFCPYSFETVNHRDTRETLFCNIHIIFRICYLAILLNFHWQGYQ